MSLTNELRSERAMLPTRGAIHFRTSSSLDSPKSTSCDIHDQGHYYIGITAQQNEDNVGNPWTSLFACWVLVLGRLVSRSAPSAWSRGQIACLLVYGLWTDIGRGGHARNHRESFDSQT